MGTRYTGQPRSGVILRSLRASSSPVRSSIWSWSQCKVSIASSTDGPMNRSAQSRHRPSSTRLPSVRMRRQSGDSAPWATISCRATDLVMDIGETIAQCAEREVKEETGLTVTAYHLVGVYSDPDHVFAYSDGEVRQEFSVCFACRILGGNIAA